MLCADVFMVHLSFVDLGCVMDVCLVQCMFELDCLGLIHRLIDIHSQASSWIKVRILASLCTTFSVRTLAVSNSCSCASLSFGALPLLLFSALKISAFWPSKWSCACLAKPKKANSEVFGMKESLIKHLQCWKPLAMKVKHRNKISHNKHQRPGRFLQISSLRMTLGQCCFKMLLGNHYKENGRAGSFQAALCLPATAYSLPRVSTKVPAATFLAPPALGTHQHHFHVKNKCAQMSTALGAMVPQRQLQHIPIKQFRNGNNCM